MKGTEELESKEKAVKETSRYNLESRNSGQEDPNGSLYSSQGNHCCDEVKIKLHLESSAFHT